MKPDSGIRSLGTILHRSCENCGIWTERVTVMPVVPRDVLVKTALCISDTYETSWIAECMEKGSRVVLSAFYGLAKIFRKGKTCIPETDHGVLQADSGVWSRDMQTEENSGRVPMNPVVKVRPERRHRTENSTVHGAGYKEKKGYIVVQCGTVCIRRRHISPARRYRDGLG